jgi:hypothetical protein
LLLFGIKIGHLVPIWQPVIGSSLQEWQGPGIGLTYCLPSVQEGWRGDADQFHCISTRNEHLGSDIWSKPVHIAAEFAALTAWHLLANSKRFPQISLWEDTDLWGSLQGLRRLRMELSGDAVWRVNRGLRTWVGLRMQHWKCGSLTTKRRKELRQNKTRGTETEEDARSWPYLRGYRDGFVLASGCYSSYV